MVLPVTKKFFATCMCAFCNFGFFLSGPMTFTNISGCNGLILIKFTLLFKQVIYSLNTSFQGILIILQNLLILDFNWYSGLLGP